MLGLLRFRVVLGAALIAAAGCAQQPQRADPDAAGTVSQRSVAAPAPATSSASAAASIQAMKSSVPSDLLVFAHDQGFRQVVIKGNNYYFCKTEDPMGSIIPVRRCLDQTQLQALRVQVREQQEQLSRPQTTTNGPPP
jgi:hypothetical protein